MVIEVDMYKDIRQSFINGESQRDIAKRLGIARQTVKKYCEGESHPGVRKPYVRPPDTVTEDVKEFILSCFKEDKDHGIKKQKHTAKRIYDRLVDETGFTGAESTIRKTVKELKENPKHSPSSISSSII